MGRHLAAFSNAVFALKLQKFHIKQLRESHHKVATFHRPALTFHRPASAVHRKWLSNGLMNLFFALVEF